jgi:hypothetical protein
MGQSLHRFELEPQRIEHACEDGFVVSISSFDHWILISWYMNFANFVVLLIIWLMCFWIDFIDDCNFASWILSIVAKFWFFKVPSHCVMALHLIVYFKKEFGILWRCESFVAHYEKVCVLNKVRDIGSLGPPPPFYFSTWWELREKLSY